MGMTFDEKCYLYGSCKCQTAGCVFRPDNGCPVYRYFKDLIVKDYEKRLKADMVAMLTEIQLEIEEHEESIIGHYGKETKESDFPSHKIERNNGRKECVDLIQQKIDTLKAESENP